MIDRSKTDRTNGLRPVMLRRPGEQRVIFVERGFVEHGLDRWRTSIFCSRGGNDDRNGRAQECQGCADEEGRERLQGIVIVIAFAFACVVRTSPSNALVHPAAWPPFHVPLVLVLHAYGKTHDPVVCLWVAPRSLFLYHLYPVGWVTRVKCLASMKKNWTMSESW